MSKPEKEIILVNCVDFNVKYLICGKTPDQVIEIMKNIKEKYLNKDTYKHSVFEDMIDDEDNSICLDEVNVTSFDLEKDTIKKLIPFLQNFVDTGNFKGEQNAK